MKGKRPNLNERFEIIQLKEDLRLMAFNFEYYKCILEKIIPKDYWNIEDFRCIRKAKTIIKDEDKNV